MATRIPLIFGGATFGAKNTNTPRIHDLNEAQKLVDLFVSHGQKAFDTSRFYGYGSSEEFLGKLDLHGSTVDTKIYPVEPGYFAPEKLRTVFHESLEALGPHKIRIFYLHSPDRSDRSPSFEDTLREINEFHKAGLIQEFGLSNFLSWEVVEFVGIAKSNGWIQPTVYQGRYNAVERTIEAELIPCLRKYGIRFFAFSPLAGGLLVGKTLTNDAINYEPGSRWDPKGSTLATWLHGRYGPLMPTFRELKAVLEKNHVGLTEAALRWIQHHSALGPNDAVLLGASSLKQVEDNLKDCESGPLPDDIVSLLDEAWTKAKANVPYYASADQRVIKTK